MKKSVQCSRIFVSFALVFCMLFGMMGIVDAGSYTNTLNPGIRTTRTVTPERHTVKIYISGGKNGSALKKDSLPGWITVNTSNADYYLATITGNTTTSVRRGSIVFTKGSNTYELYVVQNPFIVKTTSGSGPNISNVNFTTAGGTTDLYALYSCNVTGTIPDWLTVKQDGNKYTLTARPNLNGSQRYCTLSFTKTLSTYEKVTRTVKITQFANTLTGVPSTMDFPIDGAEKSFTVTTGYGTVKATVANGYSYWLRVFQNGNKITIHCDRNITTSTRTGYVHITIGDISKTVKVTMAKGYGIPEPIGIAFSPDSTPHF